MEDNNHLYEVVRKKLDKLGYQGVELFTIPYQTLCEAGGLTEKQSSYRGINQSSFPVYFPKGLENITKRISSLDLKKALLQGKRELKRTLAFSLR
jgi:hypothetical protein